MLTGDGRIIVLSNGVGWRSVLAGPADPRVILTMPADTDALFAVNDMIVFHSVHRDEALATLNQIYAEDDATYNLREVDCWTFGRPPLTILPMDTMTVTPPEGFTLHAADGWRLLWLIKTADRTYTAHGDLEAAA
ncbi:hypothetical protein [Bradyrhizobium viridifuturi]|uniref:hypothetical protein n=1 Tax=Bradyrhizobium viridifuturi TaxID=1654716 RepID=UPI00067F5300|nr:hypothetical protein [Bradyrhizobium viridifuturi]